MVIGVRLSGNVEARVAEQVEIGADGLVRFQRQGIRKIGRSERI